MDKKKMRESTNVVDRRNPTKSELFSDTVDARIGEMKQNAKNRQFSKALNSDVLKEPTPLAEQRNNDKTPFKGDVRTIKTTRDPKPKGFFKHTIKGKC